MKRGLKPRQLPKHPVKQEGGQTKAAGGSLTDKLRAYRDIHAHSLFSSLGRLVDSPFTSLLTVGVLAISIALAAGFYLLVVNLEQLTGNIEISNQISLFLKEDVSESAAKELAERIKKFSDVQSVLIITKDEALKEFQTFSGFGSAIDALASNPLPIVLEVIPANALAEPGTLEKLMQRVKVFAEVDFAQMDRQWLDRLHAIVDVARTVMMVVSILLGLAVLFITGNTIRLELHNRRDEVVIAKLVGATNAFIRRPFLYGGFWIGFFSGVGAWFIVTVMMLILWRVVENLSELYGGSFQLLFLNYSETLLLLLLSSGLSVLGSWTVLMYQLRKLKPE